MRVYEARRTRDHKEFFVVQDAIEVFWERSGVTFVLVGSDEYVIYLPAAEIKKDIEWNR